MPWDFLLEEVDNGVEASCLEQRLKFVNRSLVAHLSHGDGPTDMLAIEDGDEGDRVDTSLAIVPLARVALPLLRFGIGMTHSDPEVALHFFPMKTCLR